MIVFKATLFNLINAANIVEVDGYEIETASREWKAQGAPIMRCTCDDDNEWHFADQEVTVRDGICSAMTATGSWDNDGDEPVEVSLEFRVHRSIGPGDVETIAAPSGT